MPFPQSPYTPITFPASLIALNFTSLNPAHYGIRPADLSIRLSEIDSALSHLSLELERAELNLAQHRAITQPALDLLSLLVQEAQSLGFITSTPFLSWQDLEDAATLAHSPLFPYDARTRPHSSQPLPYPTPIYLVPPTPTIPEDPNTLDGEIPLYRAIIAANTFSTQRGTIQSATISTSTHALTRSLATHTQLPAPFLDTPYITATQQFIATLKADQFSQVLATPEQLTARIASITQHLSNLNASIATLAQEISIMIPILLRIPSGSLVATTSILRTIDALQLDRQHALDLDALSQYTNASQESATTPPFWTPATPDAPELALDPTESQDLEWQHYIDLETF